MDRLAHLFRSVILKRTETIENRLSTLGRRMPRISRRVETIRDRLGAPLPSIAAVALGLALCAAPAYLMRDQLAHNPIGGDDFVYIAKSRTFDRLVASLWIPHNAHVVPLFRIWTYLLIQLAGSLERLPDVLTVGSYVPLIAAMLAGGHLIAHESGRLSYGLIATAWIGVGSVLEPAVAWYSSSQALWAGASALVSLCLLQSWRTRGGWARMALALAATIAAGWFWSAGYLAGPAGFVYLWFDRTRKSRRYAVLPLIVGIAGAAIAIVLSGGGPFAPANFGERSVANAADPGKGFVYACQAICEGVLLANLGVDAEVEAAQAVVLVFALGLVWLFSRRFGRDRLVPNSLEASGAVLGFGSAFLSYTFRSYLPFESVRGIWVYQTVPQLGAILFAAGWILGTRGSTETVKRPRPLRGIDAPAILALTLALALIHQPRSNRLFLRSAPPVLEEEGIWAAKPLLRPRAIFLLDETARKQRRWLARLDRAETIARRLGIDRTSIRRAFGRVVGCPPEWPVALQDFDATDLLVLPPPSPNPPPTEAVRAALGDSLFIEPNEKPPWLKGVRTAWPPSRR